MSLYKKLKRSSRAFRSTNIKKWVNTAKDKASKNLHKAESYLKEKNPEMYDKYKSVSKMADHARKSAAKHGLDYSHLTSGLKNPAIRNKLKKSASNYMIQKASDFRGAHIGGENNTSAKQITHHLTHALEKTKGGSAIKSTANKWFGAAKSLGWHTQTQAAPNSGLSRSSPGGNYNFV